MSPETAAELYLLRAVGKLDSKREQKVLAKLQAMGATYASVDEFLDEFESESSIPIVLLEWVHDEWAANQATASPQTPLQFARSRVEGFLTTLE
ncbi:hypothetical protein [Alienimonas chondri]|uniref:Uncharacterized protein n=1 Tax=Alienimonas chondri TaxID=2681879 RepID=A0ABX1VBR0_9PLAN|nr:hypothetical protein [Alienimonas chondri]NNJ25158.1 hypothetical protein [Alienimonas chondri]